jgi:thiol:disulfide interchange protein DsbD
MVMPQGSNLKMFHSINQEIGKMKWRQVCLITIFSVSWASFCAGDALSGRSFDEPQFLPVDQAFVLTVNRQGNQIQLHWLVHPGYYLYRDRLSFTGMELQVGPELPAGKHKMDEIFGEVEVYYDELVVNVPITDGFVKDVDKIVVGYQGCADAGLCYPPQKREFLVKNL